MEMSSILETIRGYHKTGDLGVALVILAIGVIVTVLYTLLPIIFGGYFRRLERGKSGGDNQSGGKQFWGFLVGLIYLFIGTISLVAMFIPLAYFVLWEAGGAFWRIGGSLVLLLAITVSIFMHGFVRKSKLASIVTSAPGKTADGK
jgi:hypothetical protein